MGVTNWETSCVLLYNSKPFIPSTIRLAAISSLYLQINITWNEAWFTLQIVTQEHLAKVCFVAELSCCVPRWTTQHRQLICTDINIYICVCVCVCVFLILAKTRTLCGRTHYILLLKGSKRQLSVYDKMPIERKFFYARLIFQLSRCTVTESLQTRR